MRCPRIIPRIDIKGPNVVKGIHLEGLRVLGSPEEFAQHYYETGADELIYIDVVASLYGRNGLRSLLSRTAEKVFIPITVGGGLRSVEDIREVLRAGADKVCINSAAIRNPEFISEAANRFGSSTVVVAIEAIQQSDSRWMAFVENGREQTNCEVIEWAQRAAELGAGELLLTSVDREGTGRGFDSELIKAITNAVGIPVIAHGGAGQARDILHVIQQTGADAVSAASLFHYDTIHRVAGLGRTTEGNREFLLSGNRVKAIDPLGVRELKKLLVQEGVAIRT